MKKIPLTKGQFALVDDADFDFLNQWKWYLSDSGYACRNQHVKKGKYSYGSKSIRMHRLINKTPDTLFTDHINQDRLDNRRANLRTVDKSANGINRGKNKNNTSGVKGVYWEEWSKSWRAEIKILYRRIRLGRFKDIKDATIARKEAELKYHAI